MAEVSVGFPELVNATFGVNDGRPKTLFDHHNAHLATQSLAGASLLAKAVCQSTSMVNLPPPSLASQRPQDFVVNALIQNNADTCGSWLAGDEAGPGTLASTDKAPLRAGSLPQGKKRSAYNNEIG
ncbi:hypothetical protein [Pseudomonas sp. HMWF006]|uniref:hypothetical protein n=1 Tax=Pseudomonas sp. HMWF006 TaxID=2056843 RepID=UPI000FFCAF3B|nr:hypothetical protein [Pseudomonas sp. HMWF006]